MYSYNVSDWEGREYIIIYGFIIIIFFKFLVYMCTCISIGLLDDSSYEEYGLKRESTASVYIPDLST